VTTTVIYDMAVYNGGGYEDCLEGGTIVVPASYVQETPEGVPYIQFAVIFAQFDNLTGTELQFFIYNDDGANGPAYFNLDQLVQQP
jgi:hypothetical protein